MFVVKVVIKHFSCHPERGVQFPVGWGMLMKPKE